MSYQFWWLKTANSEMYARNPPKTAVTCYDIPSTAIAGLYWMTWWSPAKCHIQTVIINMNSHGHVSANVNKLFPLCLKIFLHFRNCQKLLVHGVVSILQHVEQWVWGTATVSSSVSVYNIQYDFCYNNKIHGTKGEEWL